MALIPPKVQWHGWNRLLADQLAHRVDDRLAMLVPGLNGAAQQTALHLASDEWQLTVTTDEGPCKVSAARDIAPPDIAAIVAQRGGAEFSELIGAPVLRFLTQWRTRRAQRADLRQTRQL